MVWGAMSGIGLSSLHIVEHGRIVDGEYYRDIILNEFFYELDSRKRKTKNITTTKMVCDFKDYWFQQDSAPPHIANETLEMLDNECPHVISKGLWPGMMFFKFYVFFSKNNSHIKNTKLHFF